MTPLTETEIRRAFVNCTKGEAKRLNVPRDLAQRPWEHLDFLGWRDPQAPDRAYLVAELDGRVQAVTLRSPSAAAARQQRRSMCALCLTTHAGEVSLMVAPKAGKAGREGNSVGVHLCDDLCCSHYVRGHKEAGAGARLHETLTVEEKIDRTVTNLRTFLGKVTGEGTTRG